MGLKIGKGKSKADKRDNRSDSYRNLDTAVATADPGGSPQIAGGGRGGTQPSVSALLTPAAGGDNGEQQ